MGAGATAAGLGAAAEAGRLRADFKGCLASLTLLPTETADCDFTIDLGAAGLGAAGLAGLEATGFGAGLAAGFDADLAAALAAGLADALLADLPPIPEEDAEEADETLPELLRRSTPRGTGSGRTNPLTIDLGPGF